MEEKEKGESRRWERQIDQRDKARGRHRDSESLHTECERQRDRQRDLRNIFLIYS
jgi:hypothetical protein